MKKINVLLICHDVDRGDFILGLPYSKLIDSLHEELEFKGFVCSQVSLPGSILIGNKSWSKVSSFESFFPGLVYLNKIEYLINRTLNKLFKLKGNYFFKIGTYEQWKKVLKKSNSKIIFTIGATTELCKAANFLNFKLIEVMHGIGYPSIPYDWDKKNKSELPSTILCLDNKTAKAFNFLESIGVEIREIPHPWYKKFAYNNLALKALSTWGDDLSFVPKDKRVILISLQWGYDGEQKEYERILENGLLPIDLINLIKDSSSDIFYCIRRHPVQEKLARYDYQKKFLDDLIKSNNNCEYIRSSKCTLTSLFGIVDGHISMSSMTVYDAALLGVKSLLLCPTLLEGGVYADYFEDLVKAGYVEKIVSNDTYIFNWVYTIKKSNSKFSLTSATEDDWNSFLKVISES